MLSRDGGGMSGFFERLLERSRTHSGVVRPRNLSIFEPPHASDASPAEDAAVFETTTRRKHDAIEEPVARSIERRESEPPAPMAARAPAAQVQFVAAPIQGSRSSSKTKEPHTGTAAREEIRHEPGPERMFSQAAPLASAAPERATGPWATREIHETREVREMVREQRTLVDRTVLERIARAGHRPTSGNTIRSLAVQAEPEIHVSIGRIEVRAVNETPNARKSPQQPSPVMGLDEYLRHKSKGAAQ